MGTGVSYTLHPVLALHPLLLLLHCVPAFIISLPALFPSFTCSSCFFCQNSSPPLVPFHPSYPHVSSCTAFFLIKFLSCRHVACIQKWMIPNYTIPLWDIYTVRMPNKIKEKKSLFSLRKVYKILSEPEIKLNHILLLLFTIQKPR